MTPSLETASVLRQGLVVPARDENSADLEVVRTKLTQRVKYLRRSIHVRHIDCGSDGSDEWEVSALTNPIYDVQRLGIYFTASPRHADVLLITGVGSSGMVASLQQTLDEMPRPTIVIAAGVDAISGGVMGEGYSSRGGVGSLVQVDVFVPGSPATPFGLLHGILTAINLIPRMRDVSSRGSRS
jgi:Ni,Fe-hydrogenase III small subunit